MKLRRINWLLLSVQLHTVVFIWGVILLLYTVLNEIIYPGNASVPLSFWQSRIAERLDTVSTWFVIYGIHVAVYFVIYMMGRWLRSRQDQAISRSYNVKSKRPAIDRLVDSDPTQSDYADPLDQSHGSLTHN